MVFLWRSQGRAASPLLLVSCCRPRPRSSSLVCLPQTVSRASEMPRRGKGFKGIRAPRPSRETQYEHQKLSVIRMVRAEELRRRQAATQTRAVSILHARAWSHKITGASLEPCWILGVGAVLETTACSGDASEARRHCGDTVVLWSHLAVHLRGRASRTQLVPDRAGGSCKVAASGKAAGVRDCLGGRRSWAPWKARPSAVVSSFTRNSFGFSCLSVGAACRRVLWSQACECQPRLHLCVEGPREGTWVAPTLPLSVLASMTPCT